MNLLDQDLIEKDIDAYLEKYEHKELLRFVAVGSVDDGKSTLIGRLLYETGGVYEDQLEDARKNSADGEIDFALITDGLGAEREQGITIDVAYRYFHTSTRKFIIADTPGHIQYTRNMATGASTADVAIILIDARLGVLQQSKRHAYIASMLGIPHLFVAVNKMDLKDYDETVYNGIRDDFDKFAEALSFKDITYIPISALFGDNITTPSDKTAWYHDKGGKTLLNHLETVTIAGDRNMEDFRYPIQYVIRPHLDYRGFAAQIASGVVKKGDEVMVLPSGKKSTVIAIDTYDGELEEAFTPQGVVLRLADEIDISRGDMLVHPDNVPFVGRTFESMAVWLSETPMDANRSYFVKHTTQMLRVNIDKVHWKVNAEDLAEIPTDHLVLNEIGRLTLTTHRPIFYDVYSKNRSTGAFILIDAVTNNTVAAGVIVASGHDTDDDEDGFDDHVGHVRSLVTKRERQRRMHQKGATIWLTGLPASGKSTAAYALERRLFDHGHVPMVIDPDDTASSFSRDDERLFAHPNRLRRMAEFARRTTDTGLLTICAFSAPSKEQRDDARKMIGDDRFIEVHVGTSLEQCKTWDSRGTYSQLAAGKFSDAADGNVGYEVPANPVLSVDPTQQTGEQIAEAIIEVLRSRGIIFS